LLPIEFPPVTRDATKYLKDEDEFCRYALEQPDWWQMMGCYTPTCYQRHTHPDFMAPIRPVRRSQRVKRIPTEYHDYLRVEAEYYSKNFPIHGHDPFNVHLIFSYITWWPIRKCQGVDIVACYRKCDDGWYKWSLEDDIGVLFHKRSSKLFGRPYKARWEEDGEDD
jgi:hypothetical protein